MTSEWINLNTYEGVGDTNVTAAISGNLGTFQRRSEIEVIGGGDKKTVTVIQNPKPYIERVNAYDDIPVEGGTALIAVFSYYSYWWRNIYDYVEVFDNETNAKITEGVSLPASPQGRIYRFVFSSNPSSASRIDNVSVGFRRIDEAAGYSNIWSLRQEGSPKVVPLAKPAQVVSTGTEGPTTWTASTDAYWINITKPSGYFGEQVQYSVTENTGPARVGIITVSYSDGNVETIRVEQAGSGDTHINVNPTIIYLDYLIEETGTIDITANTPYVIEVNDIK